MKKLIYFSMGFFIGCSLDMPIKDEITGLDVIDNIYIANETLSGVYLSIPKNRILFSKLSDDFYPKKNMRYHKDDYNLYQWKPQNIIAEAEKLWTNYYKTIAKINVLLNTLPNIATKDFSQKQTLNNIHAETLCLKALCYFELVRIFAPIYEQKNKNQSAIILKNLVKVEELPRATLEQTYKEITILLEKSLTLFPEKTKSDKDKTKEYNKRFSKIAAKALLSKVYLFWRKYKRAIDFANQVLKEKFINPNGVQAKKDYESLWKNSSKNDEVLLRFEYDKFVYSDIYDGSEEEDNYDLNHTITYEKQEYRKSVNCLLNPQKKYSLGKYRTDLQEETPTDIVYFRTAELYFIKAQSHIGLGKESEAKKNLENFFKLRLIINKNKLDLQPILQTLLNEKQKEFIGEGQRYFDMKFYKIKCDRVEYSDHKPLAQIPTDDFRWVFPIPAMELKTNKNIHQNKGW